MTCHFQCHNRSLKVHEFGLLSNCLASVFQTDFETNESNYSKDSFMLWLVVVMCEVLSSDGSPLTYELWNEGIHKAHWVNLSKLFLFLMSWKFLKGGWILNLNVCMNPLKTIKPNVWFFLGWAHQAVPWMVYSGCQCLLFVCHLGTGVHAVHTCRLLT